MPRAKRRALDRFLSADEGLRGLVAFGVRGAREMIGTPETLGAEWMLFHAFAWRRLLSATARERPQRRLRLDALPPPTLVHPPGRTAAQSAARPVAEKIARLNWSTSEVAPARVNLLIPTIDLDHFFGGYIGKFNLARKLVGRGVRVRIVSVDPVGALPPDWRPDCVLQWPRRPVRSRRDRVRPGGRRNRGEPGRRVHRHDMVDGTHRPRALPSVAAERFLYLIQEYEPFTFPMGTYAALAEQSYRFPHHRAFLK